MSRTTSRSRHAASAAAAGALLLTVSACGSASGGGESTGFHDLRYASGDARAELCDGLLGTPEQIGERLDMALTFMADNEEGCAYDNGSPDHFLVFAVAEEEPADATLYGRGDGGYVVAMSTTDTYDADRSAELVQWLTEAADAVEDDYEQWLAALPALDARTVTVDLDGGISMPEEPSASRVRGEDQLLTPGGVVMVATVPEPVDYVLVDGTPTRAADGEQLTAGSVMTLPFDNGVDQTLEFRAGSTTLAADGTLDPSTTAEAFVVASAPDGDPVTVQVVTDDAAQGISLTTGEVDDEGRGERLAAGRFGDFAWWTFKDADLQLRGSAWCCQSWRGPYQVEGWTAMPWTAQGGWAPEGTSFLELDLAAVDDESARFAALTTDGATATVDGEQYAPVAFDPDTLVYRFEVPQDPEQVEVQVHLTPDPQRYLAGRPGELTYSGQPVATAEFETRSGDLWFDASTNRLDRDLTR